MKTCGSGASISKSAKSTKEEKACFCPALDDSKAQECCWGYIIIPEYRMTNFLLVGLRGCRDALHACTSLDNFQDTCFPNLLEVRCLLGSDDF